MKGSLGSSSTMSRARSMPSAASALWIGAWCELASPNDSAVTGWSTLICVCTSRCSPARASRDPPVRGRRQLLAGVECHAVVAALRLQRGRTRFRSHPRGGWRSRTVVSPLGGLSAPTDIGLGSLSRAPGGGRWLDRMASAIRSVDAACGITLGLHMEDLEDDRRIGPAEAANVCDVLCMHGYPIYTAWCRSPTDPELVAFLTEVTRWLGGKDVLFAEFGAATRNGDPERGPSPLLGEDEAARYTERAFARLHAAGALGGLVWCYSDYDRAIWSEPPLDRAPHERHFGLWRADGTPKPAVATLTEWSGRLHVAPPPLNWTEDDRKNFYTSPRDTLVRLYRAYTGTLPMARPLL